MQNKKKLIVILLLAFFMFLGNVKAEEENKCNVNQLSELRTMAANVKITYVPVTTVEKLDEPDFETGATTATVNYLDVKIYNINSKLKVSYRDVNGEEKVLTHLNVGSDGTITLRQIPSSYNVTYSFEIYSSEYGCTTHTLRTIKVTLPRYNFYSQLAACADIPDYYLCQEYTTYEVDGSTFYDKVDEYKAKLLTLEEAGNLELEDNTSITTSVMATVSKNKYLIVGIVVAIGVILTIVILKRKKSVL